MHTNQAKIVESSSRLTPTCLGIARVRITKTQRPEREAKQARNTASLERERGKDDGMLQKWKH